MIQNQFKQHFVKSCNIILNGPTPICTSKNTVQQSNLLFPPFTVLQIAADIENSSRNYRWYQISTSTKPIKWPAKQKLRNGKRNTPLELHNLQDGLSKSQETPEKQNQARDAENPLPTEETDILQRKQYATSVQTYGVPFVPKWS